MRRNIFIIIIATMLIASTLLLSSCTCTTIGGKVYKNYNGWDDLRTPVNAVKVSAAAPPTWVTFRGSQVLQFEEVVNPALQKAVYFSLQLPHSYKEGTDLYVHVHYTYGSDNRDHTAVWALYYSYANINDVFSQPDFRQVTTTHGDSAQHLVASFDKISGAGLKISSMFVCELFRDSTDVEDTYKDDLYLLEVDVHFEQDSMGSTTQWIK